MRNKSILFIALALFLCLFMQSAHRALAQDDATKSGTDGAPKKGRISKKVVAAGVLGVVLLGGMAYMATKKKPA